MVSFPSVGTVSPNSSGGSTTLTTSGQSVTGGAYIYVYVAMYGSSLSAPTSIADNQSGTYNLLVSGNNGQLFLWLYRRAGPVSTASSFSITVTPSTSSVPILINSIEVQYDGGIDALSTIHSGTGTSETSYVTTTIANDLVLFFGADNTGTFVNYGTGQTAITAPSPQSNITGWGSYQTQSSAGTASSSRTISASKAWIAINLAITPQNQWSGLAGKPFITVSAIGLTSSPASTIANNGADYGPDTPSTATSGIQEAINSLPSSGGTVFCIGGAYSISAALYNTGNSQTIIFAPGTTVTFATGTLPLTTGAGAPVLIMIGALNNTSSHYPSGSTNFSHCKWSGYGATIIIPSGYQYYNSHVNVFGLIQAGHYEGSSIVPMEDLVVEGFSIQNVPSVAVYIGCENYDSSMGYANQLASVRVTDISATWSANSILAFGIIVQGGVRAVLIEDCIMDTSSVASGQMASNCLIRANSGYAEQVRVSRCTFINNTQGNSVEIQANNSSIATTLRRDLQEVLLEDCIFDSGSSTVQGSGSGGAYIDDNNGGTTLGLLYNIEFRRCQFVNSGVTYLATTSMTGPFPGYVRFTDGSLPGSASGSFPNRAPGDGGWSLATVPNGTAYENPYAFDVRLLISGGSVSSIEVNGVVTGLLSGVFVLRVADAITIAYTSGSPPTVTIQSQ